MDIFVPTMKKAFATNILFLLSVNLIIKPFYLFGIDRTAQNVVGPEDFGLFWALFNFVYLFQVINDLGIYNFNSTFISQNRHLIGKYFGHVALLKIITALGFFIVVVIAFWCMSYEKALWPMVLPICLNQILVSFIFFVRSNIAGLGFYRLDSIISVLDKVMMIIICSFLLWGPPAEDFNIMWFIYAQTASLLITLFAGVLILLPKIERWKFHWHMPTLISLLKKALPFALILVLSTLYTRIDSVMLERMLENGQYEAGVYVSGYRLLDAANMVSFLFASLLLPMFSRQIKDKIDVSPLFESAVGLNVFIAVTITTLTITFGKPIMSMLYVHSTPYWASVMQMLMWGYLFMGLSYISGALLLASHNVSRLNKIYFLGMVVNILINYVVIPVHGAFGAACATLGTQALVAVSSLILVITQLRIRISIPWLAKILLLGTIGLLLILFFAHRSDSPSWVLWFVIIGLLFAVLGSVLGLIPFKTLFDRSNNE